ncbi:MAG: hypothetical protein WA678_06705, partial [Rhabdochlamydiaceae bacterium]
MTTIALKGLRNFTTRSLRSLESTEDTEEELGKFLIQLSTLFIEHRGLELPGSSSVSSVLSRERSERVVKFLKPLRAMA